MQLIKEKDQLQSLLREELSCFKEMLNRTIEYQQNLNQHSTDALLQLLEEREVRINLINRLENERTKLELSVEDYEPLIDIIKQDIEKIALNLVRVDAEFLNILAISKDSILKEISQTNDKKHLLENQKITTTSRLIDIKQK